jgi:NitT/TauT family transport system permease protein
VSTSENPGGAGPGAAGSPALARPLIWQGLFGFRGKTSRGVNLTVGVLGFVVIIGLWQLASALGLMSPVFLPSPWAVMVAFYHLFADFGFLNDIGISVYRVWVAFLVSAVMAIPLGIMMSSFRIVNSINEPIIDFLRYLPVPALVPLTIIWFGIGEVSKITLLWMGTFFQLVPLIADDANRVPHEYIEIARTVGAKPRDILKDVILRAMLPSMVDNLRITLGWCWTYLVIAEIVASSSGIGYVIWDARRYMQTPTVMAGVVAIGVIGLVTDQAIRILHRRIFSYLH